MRQRVPAGLSAGSGQGFGCSRATVFVETEKSWRVLFYRTNIIPELGKLLEREVFLVVPCVVKRMGFFVEVFSATTSRIAIAFLPGEIDFAGSTVGTVSLRTTHNEGGAGGVLMWAVGITTS